MFQKDSNSEEFMIIELRKKKKNFPAGFEHVPDDVPVMLSPLHMSFLRLERGDYLVSPIFFKGAVSVPNHWTAWVESELKDVRFVQSLDRAGVLGAIVASTKFEFNPDLCSIRRLVRRWNTSSHTFVCSWGEFTPTLDDVSTLIGLPICGDLSPWERLDTSSLSGEAEELSTCLRNSREKDASRSSFASWIRYFTNGSGHATTCRKTAFVCYWLCRFVFSCASDTVSKEYFPMAILLARGRTIPLAALYLGSLYNQLDVLANDEVSSAGNYSIDVPAFVSNFLQLFMFERFKGYGPTPHSSVTIGKMVRLQAFEKVSRKAIDLPLYLRWCNCKSSNDIGKFLDFESSFVFRPLAPTNFIQPISMMPGVGTELVEVWNCDEADDTIDLERTIVVRPCLLPVFFEKSVGPPSAYNPQRVMRQFGLDQMVPDVPHFSLELDSILSHFSRAHLHSPLGPDNFTATVAGPERFGICSDEYRLHWTRVLKEFCTFLMLPPEKVPGVSIEARHPRLKVFTADMTRDLRGRRNKNSFTLTSRSDPANYRSHTHGFENTTRPYKRFGSSSWSSDQVNSMHNGGARGGYYREKDIDKSIRTEDGGSSSLVASIGCFENVKKRKRSNSHVEIAKGIDHITVSLSGGSSEHSHIRSHGGSPILQIDDDAYLLDDQMPPQTNDITGHEFVDLRGDYCKEMTVVGSSGDHHPEICVDSIKVDEVDHNISVNMLLDNADCDLPIQVAQNADFLDLENIQPLSAKKCDFHGYKLSVDIIPSLKKLYEHDSSLFANLVGAKTTITHSLTDVGRIMLYLQNTSVKDLSLVALDICNEALTGALDVKLNIAMIQQHLISLKGVISAKDIKESLKVLDSKLKCLETDLNIAKEEFQVAQCRVTELENTLAEERANYVHMADQLAHLDTERFGANDPALPGFLLKH